MRHRRTLQFLLALSLTFLAAGHDSQQGEESDPNPDIQTVHADVVATGIPGAGAIAQIGTFHKGGPFHDNAAFAATTQPGQVLDRTRLLVASSSNFGAPLARTGEAPGSVLSIDVSGGSIAVPPNFASAGGQASALGGRVIVYAAQTPAFLNGLNNPHAVTSDRPSVSLPLGISINNGFGRVWFANAPAGSAGDGTITVIDPSGIPLAGAPDPVAGGVFAGSLTNRSGSTQGLTAGAVATALVGKSPDQSIRAVFFAALADGSITQVHVQKGVDALAPPGSFMPIQGIGTAAAESSDPRTVTRVGMIFNWVPTRILFVSDPLGDRILALDISDEGVTPRHCDGAGAARCGPAPRHLRRGRVDHQHDRIRRWCRSKWRGGAGTGYVHTRPHSRPGTRASV